MSWNIKTPGDYINGPLTVAGSATITGALTSGTTTLVAHAAGYTGKVGIGTATPSFTLQVLGTSGSVADFAGSGVAGQQTLVRIRTASPNSNGFLIQGNNTTDEIFLNNFYNAALIFGTNNVERYRIDNTGIATWSVAGTTAMTLNSTGLGIGVAPQAKIHAYTLNPTDGVVELLQNLSTSGQTGAKTKYEVANVGASGIGTPNGTTNALAFFVGGITSAEERARIDASGNLLVGTTSNSNGARVNIKTASVTSALSLNGVTGDTAQESLVINKFDSNSTTSQVFARFTNNNGSGGSGQINGNGANACAFGSFSDSRLKENILTLPSQLANILSLRPVEFDYKDGSGHQIGFVAQEMQEVYSDAVGEQNGFLTVTGWSKTEARLVSAIKELAAKVQALESKLA